MACGIHSKKDLKKILCFPLAVFAIVFALFQIGYASWLLVGVAKSWDEGSKFSFWIGVLLYGLMLIFGVVGLIAVLTKWAAGINFFKIAIKITIMTHVFSLILTWILAFCAWGGVESKDVPKMDRTRVIAIIILTIITAIAIFLCWVALSCFASLQRIIQEGGSGFEKKNYVQIRKEKTGGQTHPNDSSSDSDN